MEQINETMANQIAQTALKKHEKYECFDDCFYFPDTKIMLFADDGTMRVFDEVSQKFQPEKIFIRYNTWCLLEREKQRVKLKYFFNYKFPKYAAIVSMFVIIMGYNYITNRPNGFVQQNPKNRYVREYQMQLKQINDTLNYRNVNQK